MSRKKLNRKKNFVRTVFELKENEISLAATIGVALFVLAPALMAVLALFIRRIDFIVTYYPKILRDWIFTLDSALFLILWLLTLVRFKREGKKLLRLLVSNPAVILFFLAALWMFISQCVNGLEYTLDGYYKVILEETFAMELGYLLTLFPGAALVTEKKHKTLLIRMHMITSAFLVLAAFVLWHTQSDSSIFYDWTERFASIFTNTNYYGYYLAISVPLCACAFLYEEKLAWKLAAIGTFAVNTVGLSVNDTTGAWVGSVAALLFIFVTGLIVDKKFNPHFLIVMAVFAVCFYVPGHILGSFESTVSQLGGDIASVVSGDGNGGHAGSGRWGIWKDSIGILMYDPWFGVGFEGIAYRGYQAVSNVRPHNEFLQYALFHGVPATLLYFLGAFAVFVRALRLKAELDRPTLICLTAAFGYLVSSFFGLTIYATAPYLFLFLGLGYVRKKQK